MADEESREEQLAELEAIEAIFGEDYEKLENEIDNSGVECARFQVDLLDIEPTNSVTLRLLFMHTSKYPGSSAIHVVVHPLSGISGPQRKSLQKHLDDLAQENIGIPTAFTLCEEAKEYLIQSEGGGGKDGQIGNKNKTEDEDENSKFETLDNTQSEKVEVISSKAVGIPVTLETFNEWKEKFLEEFVYKGKSKEQLEEEESGGKLTGREFFESKAVVVSVESASFWESEASLVDSET